MLTEDILMDDIRFKHPFTFIINVPKYFENAQGRLRLFILNDLLN